MLSTDLPHNRTDQVGPDTRSACLDWTLRHVASAVAHDFGLEVAHLTASTRGAPRAAFARQAAMYLLHVVFALSFETIGRLFGRDRTTVSHACRVVEDHRDDIWFDCRLATLERVCRRVPELSDILAESKRG